MKGPILFLLQLITLNSMAQKQVQGEYIFSKQEMVAGFKFLANGRFEFFFSYGVVDRYAKGTFSVKDDSIKLKSEKEAGKDFTIKDQSHSGTGYTLKFEDANSFLLSNIRCTFFIGKEQKEEFTDEKGEVNLLSCQHSTYL
jgi:hypothetical protein